MRQPGVDGSLWQRPPAAGAASVEWCEWTVFLSEERGLPLGPYISHVQFELPAGCGFGEDDEEGAVEKEGASVSSAGRTMVTIREEPFELRRVGWQVIHKANR